MEIHLVRHTTTSVARGICYGQSDIPLADTAFSEINDIYLDVDYDLVYSSPLKRCTAILLQKNIPFISDHRLMEISYGDWELLAWDDITFEEYAQWGQDYINIAPPNGESLIDIKTRVQAFFNSLFQKKYKKVLIVSHGGVIRLCYHLFRHIDIQDIFSLDIPYGSIHKFVVAASNSSEL